MTILIDLTSLADNFSGIERYAACLVLELIKNRNNDYILCFKGKVHMLFESVSKQENVKTVIIEACKKLLFNQVKLPLVIRKYRADYYLFLAFPVPWLLWKKNMVSTIHDICCWDCPETMNGMSKWYFRISHRLAMLKCSNIITISKFSEQRISERLNYDANKIWLIYCGIDDKFNTFIEDKGGQENIKKKYNLPDKYILSLSTLEPRKNLQLLVKAYRKLVLRGDMSISLVLAGRKGWKLDALLNGIEQSVKEQIYFTGFIADEDLPDVYGNATLFVFPSKYEGFGMPPLEAMACGTPVLSSDASSLSEVLGDAALYFKNEDDSDLTMGLLRAISLNAEEIKRLILEGKKQSEKFSWAVEAKKIESRMR
ncbi:glycosyltransferase family 1 protein [Desulfosporosinus sp. Sb-LF]|uniref:glycosyltransferase family 4 protein n=1 Tax=Desulfosporosinus sp. Sb-LF TaxID=2560027 RepID=UPI00107F247E|nr:glycosyltransferase family 1 protein [Desulfosporosinus sp. Sb-LF]TGE31901.1 glycosyltransferase family 1 protein [Desulfosporosinus sp. Sb-LF]